MFFKHIIICFLISFTVNFCSASVSQELLLLDTTLVYQLANTDSNLVDIHHLIGNLISYKVHISKLIYQFVSDANVEIELRKQILQLQVPTFLKKGFDIHKLQTVYNLSDLQVHDIELEIARIWMNWDQFQKLRSSDSSIKITRFTLPFYLIEKAGTNLAKYFENATHEYVHDMLIEFSTYYYFLGKIIKNMMKEEEDSLTHAKALYEGEKPEFLKKFVHTSGLRYAMHLSFSESQTVKRWIKRISARWFTFMNIYEKKLDIKDKPNLRNLNLLKEADERILEKMKTGSSYVFEDLIQDLKSFLEYLCLILRRNYKHRQFVIEEARKFYNQKDPLFLREISQTDYFQTVMKINNLQFFSVRHFINQINNKWPFLVGTKEEYTRPPGVNTHKPFMNY